MAIIIEDGTIIAGSNSYATASHLAKYVAAIGYSITGDSNQLLTSASRYIETLSFIGLKYTKAQSMQWPRIDAEIDGFEIGIAEIPQQLIDLQLTIAIEIDSGEDPYNPASNSLPVIKERVEGAVTVEYATPTTAVSASKELASTRLIDILTGGSFGFASVSRA